ncbi:murein biosynthesis integral membrane protein MurJ [Algiphilus sp.]|uniref:murein biosynthesis integral membrane protein MurJ n=1 Tax=Algiphilus sp. TaxID=1872431 RepID=UPI001CA62F56|nr:murein biosynthesis integral membrane protein MurJ [Algiphilus acroporae]MCR9091934.1 murein biosynthesis integral membrane protein MurJ [Pseudomonadota bacterium]
MSRSLARSSGIVSLATLLSRLLGFVRDMLQAALFGAGAAMDAFFVAFRIPNLFRRMFAEGAFQQAFVPVLKEAQARGTEAEVRQLVDSVASTLGAFLMLLTAAGVLAAPLLMTLFAPGFREDAEKFATAVTLLRWTFPYLLFISLAALASGILHAHGRFAVPAITPVLLNISLIVAALLYAPSVEALAIAVFVAGILQLCFQLPSVWRLGLMPRPCAGWRDPAVRRIVLLMLPIMLGASISQLSLLLDSVIASFLPGDGSVSWLWYADRLMEFPLGVFSIAIATVILPYLSGQFANADSAGFSATLDWALRLVLLLGVPAALGLLVLAEPIVATLFHHNAFQARDVEMTAAALVAYAFAFIGFSFVKVLIPAFYSRQETKAPLQLGAIAFGAGMVVSVTLSVTLVRAGYEAPHVGIAASTAAASWLHAWLLYRRLRRDAVYQPTPGWAFFLLRLLLAAAVMSVVAYLGAHWFGSWLTAGALERAGGLLAVIAAAALAYLLALLATGLKPWRMLAKSDGMH